MTGLSRSGLRLLMCLTLLTTAATANAQTDPPAAPGTTVDASKGGVTFSSGVNSLTIGARAQVRWTLEDREDGDFDLTGSGVGASDGLFSQFDISRLRLTLSGGAYRPWLRYSFQFEMSRAGGVGGSRLKDALIEIRPAGRTYSVVVGQFKAPFGLQQLTSSGRQQFVDRAITDGKFTPGRDLGVMFSGTAASRTVGYQAGVFNGAGESVTQNNESLLWVGRMFFNPLGPYALSEGALGTAKGRVLHLGLGARTGKQIRGRTTIGVFEGADSQTALNGEFAYRQGRFFSTAEYFWMTEEQENPVAGPDLDSRGFHAQAGYMLRPTTEVGVRYAVVDGDTRVSDSQLRELRGVFGYFWREHNLKLQADLGQVRYDSGFAALPVRARVGLPVIGLRRAAAGRSVADTQIRVQLQLGF